MYFIVICLVCGSSNDVGHINKIMLRRARLVPGLVTTFSGSTIQVFALLWKDAMSLLIVAVDSVTSRQEMAIVSQ